MNTPISLILTSVLISTVAYADCNYGVAESASRYLNELEKASLQKYQNSSVCEVLAVEAEKCSQNQIAELNEKVNLNVALDSYCEEYRKVVKNEKVKNRWLKGAELLSWQDNKGIYWFALLPDTNRLKKADEIIDSKLSQGDLNKALAQLPPKTSVIWNNVIDGEDRKKLDFTFPPETVAKSIRQVASKADLKLEMR